MKILNNFNNIHQANIIRFTLQLSTLLDAPAGRAATVVRFNLKHFYYFLPLRSTVLQMDVGLHRDRTKYTRTKSTRMKYIRRKYTQIKYIGQNISGQYLLEMIYRTKYIRTIHTRKKYTGQKVPGQRILHNKYRTKYSGQNIPDKIYLISCRQLDVSVRVSVWVTG